MGHRGKPGAEAHREHIELQAASPFVFQRTVMPESSEGEAESAIGLFKLAASRANCITRRRFQRMQFESTATVFTLDIGPGVVASISGGQSRTYSMELIVDGIAPSELCAGAIAEQIALIREADEVSIKVPPEYDERAFRAYFSVTLPRDRPLAVRSVRSAIDVLDLAGDANIENTAGVVRLLNTSGGITARGVGEGSWIIFASGGGQVRLTADGEINVMSTVDEFSGVLDASAVGAIRVLLPCGFSSPLAADVCDASMFACRTKLWSPVTRVQQLGRVRFGIGEGNPAFRLTSRQSAIVIDAAEG